MGVQEMFCPRAIYDSYVFKIDFRDFSMQDSLID